MSELQKWSRSCLEMRWHWILLQHYGYFHSGQDCYWQWLMALEWNLLCALCSHLYKNLGLNSGEEGWWLFICCCWLPSTIVEALWQEGEMLWEQPMLVSSHRCNILFSHRLKWNFNALGIWWGHSIRTQQGRTGWLKKWCKRLGWNSGLQNV